MLRIRVCNSEGNAEGNAENDPNEEEFGDITSRFVSFHCKISGIVLRNLHYPYV